MSTSENKKTCIVCDGDKLSPYLEGLLRCEDCGHVAADLSISEEELHALYEKNYFFGEEYCDYLKDKKVLQKNFRLRLKTLGRFLDRQRRRSVFEIGCAYGFFLEEAQKQFEQAAGMDVTPDGVNHARDELKLNASQGDFLKHDFGDERFDVMCMWDTIEHLHSPHLFIEKMSKLTKPGGLAAITTGNIESFNAKRRGKDWRLIHPPTHVHYFSMDSLEQLLRRHGFKTVYRKHCGFYRSTDNVAYNILVLRKKSEWLYQVLKKTGLLSLDFYLNMYDIMYLIAEKED